jgi:2-dehydropantoate 2-reductase
VKILVLGAGAVGGYFGGRLVAAGRDVTFLVRPARAALLAEHGLHVRSPYGDVDVPAPATVTADAIPGPYDLVVLSAKSYDLDSAIDSVAPAVGPDTAVLPLLNGIRHLDALDARFGAGSVLGGMCLISTVLRPDGSIDHLSDTHSLVQGERAGGRTARTAAVQEALSGAGFDARESDDVLQDMWEKWVFLATAAGTTALMRAAIGDVVAAGGTPFIEQLLDDVAGVADAQGRAPRPAAREQIRGTLTQAGSTMTASMLRDMESGARIEADHVFGDLLARAGDRPVEALRTVYVAAKAYEARRARES